MPPYDDIELTTLLRALPPPPPEWVQAAKAVPRIQRQLAEVLPQLESTAGLRAAETAALEEALRQAGAEPDPLLVAAARRHFARE